MIRLRGHHLICLHFYRGEGYNREFVENLENVMRRATEGEEVEIVQGADDICRACPTLQGEKCVAKPGVDAEIREMDAEAAAYLGVEVGSKVLWHEIKAKVMETPKEWLAAFCEGCDWGEVCAEKKKALGLG
ncbi:DUF1284 domain-containing protein [Desulfofundulus sp. TPOSR]|uniref:DUF1284 domain-containing protein n=1 Tax=Desulfofundulus sp. TPOSR TaxID=2714340 RepID=UPI00140A44A6|nr:DUF1284 domain-containing protein [Desulfofundulus sp. TPOSR]NHM25886.1 DUF1284 domain-containing protein [Desulfofundulus sp. TPOSR]